MDDYQIDPQDATDIIEAFIYHHTKRISPVSKRERQQFDRLIHDAKKLKAIFATWTSWPTNPPAPVQWLHSSEGQP